MSPSGGRPMRVFISYARADSVAIDRLEAELVSFGFETWVDRTQLEGGQPWADQIERAIQNCDVVVVGLSPAAVASPWVKNELYYAHQLGKRIIPLLLRPVERTLLLLAALQHIDLHADPSAGLQQLRLHLLHLGAGASASASPAPVHHAVSHHLPPTAQDRADQRDAQLVPLPAPAPAPILRDLCLQGMAALAHGDLERAEAALRQVVERDPAFEHGLAAQQLAEAQRQLRPLQIERLRTWARHAEAQGAWGEALNAWRALVEREPDDGEAQEGQRRAEQNEKVAWLYEAARRKAEEQDWETFRHHWQVLRQRAPEYGDPDGILLLDLDSLLVRAGDVPRHLRRSWRSGALRGMVARRAAAGHCQRRHDCPRLGYPHTSAAVHLHGACRRGAHGRVVARRAAAGHRGRRPHGTDMGRGDRPAAAYLRGALGCRASGGVVA